MHSNYIYILYVLLMHKRKSELRLNFFISNSVYKLKYQEVDRAKFWKGIKLFAALAIISSAVI